MIDLRTATNCIKAMKEDGSYRNDKIGRIKTDVIGLTSIISGVPLYSVGRVVLFHEELFPSDADLCMGEYIGQTQQPTGKVTVESPLTQKEIDKRKAKGLKLMLPGTTVGVPRDYVEEIKI